MLKLKDTARAWRRRWRPEPSRHLDANAFGAARLPVGAEPGVVPVSTVAPFHNSIGDLSTAQVTQEYLARRGRPSYLTSFWDHEHPHVVLGGGEIVGAPSSGAWTDVKPAFLPCGEHVLNAVGVQRDVLRLDLGMLEAYRYVAVRDPVGAEILAEGARIEPAVVPCPATLQPGIPLTVLAALPRFERLARLVAGEYVVVHRHPSLIPAALRLARAGHPVVVVDMQAHARHRWFPTGLVVPWTHSPMVIQGLVDAAQAVLTSSLHLAIFAIGAGKPFAAIDTRNAQSDKVRRYLRRAGLEDAMGREVDLDMALAMRERVAAASIAERAAATAHLERVLASVA